LRFLAEALSADVQYIPEFSKYEDWKKKTSVQDYNDLLIFLKEGNRTFDDICKDYAAKDIVYTNQTVGRYYFDVSWIILYTSIMK